MKIEEFEKELQLIDKDLSIRPNNPPKRVLDAFPDTDKLAVILYRGTEICVIPNFEIFDQKSGTYGVDLRQDGHFIPHRTRPEALAQVKDKLERLKNDREYYKDFFGIEESSDEELNKPSEAEMTVIDEVPIELKEVKGGMIEGAK